MKKLFLLISGWRIKCIEFGVRFPVSAVWKKQKMFLLQPLVKVSIVVSLRDREVACSASDRQGSNFESCVWRTVSSQSSHHPQEVILAQFSLYVHKRGLKPDLFVFVLGGGGMRGVEQCFWKNSSFLQSLNWWAHSKLMLTLTLWGRSITITCVAHHNGAAPKVMAEGRFFNHLTDEHI